jgi:hypothetical protein
LPRDVLVLSISFNWSLYSTVSAIENGGFIVPVMVSPSRQLVAPDSIRRAGADRLSGELDPDQG